MSGQKENRKNLKSVGFIIGILAGKGGVGKSTVTVEIAKCLAHEGKKVGILDGDLYGPSIRHLLPEKAPPQIASERVVPARSKEGIEVISAAYFSKGAAPSIVRAPIAAQIISQFIEEVEWGELDFLLVDFPPGTGDIQISLMQKISFNGALVITTPQELSLLDVRKSMQMCIQMGVPLLGVVENMSYFSKDGASYALFGKGGGEKLSKEFGVPLLAQIPIDPGLNQEETKKESIPIFVDLSKKVYEQLKEEKGCKIIQEDRYHFSIEWLDGKKSLYRFDTVQLHCPCVECLRKKEIGADSRACRQTRVGERVLPRREVQGARCKEPQGGLLKQSNAEISPRGDNSNSSYLTTRPDIEGEKIIPVGRYGIQMIFSEGCSKGIYPFSLLRGLDR